jgi:hypothetical protein
MHGLLSGIKIMSRLLGTVPILVLQGHLFWAVKIYLFYKIVCIVSNLNTLSTGN